MRGRVSESADCECEAIPWARGGRNAPSRDLVLRLSELPFDRGELLLQTVATPLEVLHQLDLRQLCLCTRSAHVHAGVEAEALAIPAPVSARTVSGRLVRHGAFVLLPKQP